LTLKTTFISFILFVDVNVLEEAGVDGGGLFKEFIGEVCVCVCVCEKNKKNYNVCVSKNRVSKTLFLYV